jgi:hypothetical protein
LGSFAFLFGLILSFDDAVPARARIGIAYLGFIAFVHLWLGAITIKDYFVAVLFEYLSVWLILILVRAIRGYTLQHLSRGPDFFPDLSPQDTFELVAAIVIASSLMALWGVVAMARLKKAGYGVWLAVIAVSIGATLWMVFANAIIIVDGAPLYSNSLGPPVWWSLCLPLSYAIAYWQARWEAGPE